VTARPNLPTTTPGAAATDLETENVLPFALLPPKRAPYRPHESNGTVYAIESHMIEYDAAGNAKVIGVDFSAIHVSASGDSVGGPGGGFADLAAAEQAAWREARRRNAIFIFSTAEEIGQSTGGRSDQ
jgi:hypothetical protein